MSLETRLFYLRIALVVFGLTFMFGIYPLTFLWPSGWAWGSEHHSHYLLMIIAIYATLGVFLLIAARNPAQHKSLIWFTVWSSVVHAGVMTAQALGDGTERGHLIGDGCYGNRTERGANGISARAARSLTSLAFLKIATGSGGEGGIIRPTPSPTLKAPVPFRGLPFLSCLSWRPRSFPKLTLSGLREVSDLSPQSEPKAEIDRGRRHTGPL